MIGAIPGYTGHIPGAQSEGRYGASNHRLYWESHGRSVTNNEVAETGNQRGLKYRPGLDVVGYTGFIPGKNAGNVFAKTFSQANYESQKLKLKETKSVPATHDEYVVKVRRRFEELTPSNSRGNFPMYFASQDNPRSVKSIP